MGATWRRRLLVDTMILPKWPGGCREMWARAGMGMASVETVLISGLRYS
jgi:hypothetical protein